MGRGIGKTKLVKLESENMRINSAFLYVRNYPLKIPSHVCYR